MNLSRFVLAPVLIPVCLGLFACASNEPKPPKTTDSIFTIIQPDGTKQFSYTLKVEMAVRDASAGRKGGGKGRKGRGRPDGPPPDGGRDNKSDNGDDELNLEKLRHLTEEGLLAKLDQTQYCRSGYQQLATESRRGAMNISGACNDKATDADRAAFPNPAAKKVIEERLD